MPQMAVLAPHRARVRRKILRRVAESLMDARAADGSTKAKKASQAAHLYKQNWRYTTIAGGDVCVEVAGVGTRISPVRFKTRTIERQS